MSLGAIRSQASSLDIKEHMKYLVYDYFKSIKNIDIDENTILFKNSTELDGYLLNSASNNDILINFDGFHVFSESVVRLFNFRCANFHPSMLPAYGGINPISWGLLNQEKKWGFSWHRITKEIDRGEVLYQEIFDLPQNVTQMQLNRACILGGLRNLNCIISILLTRSKNIVADISNSPQPSYYYGNLSPSIFISTSSDIKKFSKIIPYNPNKSWRWTINLVDRKVTALSSTNLFGDIILTKNYEIDGEKFYYGD